MYIPVCLYLHTAEAPCGAHVFEGFFGLENGPVKSNKSQEKTLFGKDFPKPAKTQPHSRKSVSDSHLLHEHALCKAVVGASVLLNLLPDSVVRVVRLGNSKLCEFPQRGACTISVKDYYTRFVVENSKNLACSYMERE